ncbi:hypothetical protein [Kutzneria sp. 744]|uniref:hypothetical protein n=1 Tax=Kutzneria sp. (strain 744) TaxID=345341 RepID=UPI0003EECE46|nr:hypothetical protein [Kutzneria sp. 744]EWM12618.1 isoniazid inducible protein inic [Kutzneria sp. 744]
MITQELLTEDTRAMLEWALRLYRGSAKATNFLTQQRQLFEEPLRVGVTGRPKAGKSTLLDALDEDDFIEGHTSDVDAVLHLTGPVRAEDRSALQGNPIPVNTIVVLARADELGGGRVDAMSSAKMIARRLRAEPELGQLCQDVVAVAGLLAVAGRTLTDAEFDALVALAALPREELDELLLSTDRFMNPALEDVVLRQGLLECLGLFGIRLCTTLVRRGYGDPSRLAAELVQRSGLNDLRLSIRRHFTERAPVLKARSALVAVETVLRAEPRPEARGLHAEVERIQVTTQDFRELRLLAALQTGRIELPSEIATEAEQLLGLSGTSPANRLGSDDGADLLHIAMAVLDRWQAYASNPVWRRAQTTAAKTVVHTCEAIIDTLTRP